MKPKTQELLYFLLWSFDRLARPTWRNMTDSFEAWAYRNGFHRQLAELERRQFLESQQATTDCSAPADRVFRLTEAGRLCALGGRDPEACWKRSWDGRWRLVLFDLPMAQSAQRDRLRRYLRDRGFGYLQHSVWVSPNPMAEAKALLSGATANVGSLILLEARPCAGETDEEIVASAWDFAEINRLHADHSAILNRRPCGQLLSESDRKAFHQWAGEERMGWLAATSKDPLLPEPLLPKDYLGRKAWQLRKKVLGQAAEQLRSFRNGNPPEK